MNRYRMEFAPQVWKPKLNPWIVGCLRPLRWRHQQRTQQLMQIDVAGSQGIRAALDRGEGIMIMPNHSSHADPFTIYAAADQIGTTVHIMATWHVFHEKSILTRWLLRTHGCFSVDREANDIGAFKQAVEILQNKPQPLVVFPEGEIYHCNGRVTPFREGAAAMAIAAARRAERKIACVPCAISYRYVDDPTESLLRIMGQLEQAILWREQTHRTLPERIYRFAEALLVLKELEYFQGQQSGTLSERIVNLGNRILSEVESRHGVQPRSPNIPERVKEIRRIIIEKISCQEPKCTAEETARLTEDLEDVFLVVQSFSYPGDYVSQNPSLERMAETLDKFEEDVLALPTATIRGRRHVAVQFAEPIEVSGDRKSKPSASSLTQQVEERVQAMLDANANLPAA